MSREQTMKYRLGIFVLGAAILLAVLVVLFGEFRGLFKGQVPYALVVPQAPGVVEGTPIRKSGIRIGEVTSVDLDPDTGAVTIRFYVETKYKLRRSDLATLGRGLVMGDASINFTPKPDGDRTFAERGHVFASPSADEFTRTLDQARDLLPISRDAIEEMRQTAKRFNEFIPELRRTNAELQVTLGNVGRAAEGVDNLLRGNQERIATAIDNFATVAGRIADFMTPENQKNLDAIVRNFRTFSDELPKVMSPENRELFNDTLKNAQAALKNIQAASERLTTLLSEENQANVTETLRNARTASARLEEVVKNYDGLATDLRASTKTLTERADKVAGEAEEFMKDGRALVRRVSDSAEKFEQTLESIRGVADSISERAPVILRNVEEASARLGEISVNVSEFTKALATGDGTIRRLVSDPTLFNNLNDAARNVGAGGSPRDRIMADLALFADKIARHPELLGVSGTVNPSSGVKR